MRSAPLSVRPRLLRKNKLSAATGRPSRSPTVAPVTANSPTRPHTSLNRSAKDQPGTLVALITPRVGVRLRDHEGFYPGEG
jgi:hypothetical protein